MNIYPWQTTQWQQVRSIYDSGRMPHALLLYGQAGLGIPEFASILAAAILTDNFTDSGVESSDSRDWHLFQSHNHPDFIHIQPDEEGKQIKVDQIRGLIDFLQYTTQYGRKKIAIIDPADALNRSAANGLLKTLEEPPDDSLLILVSNQPQLLPITIRSRCQNIQFSYQESPESVTWLNENIADSSKIELAMTVTGAPLSAKAFIESDQISEREGLVNELKLLQKKQIEPISVAERWNSAGAKNTVISLQGFFHDMLKLKLYSEKETVSNRDLTENLRHLIKRLDLLTLLGCSRILIELKQQLDSTTSYNTQGLLETFILHWQSLKIDTTN